MASITDGAKKEISVQPINVESHENMDTQTSPKVKVSGAAFVQHQKKSQRAGQPVRENVVVDLESEDLTYQEAY